MIDHVLHVVGARPNFMKLAPVHRALHGQLRQTVVHTGQHYDSQMSEVFFSQLDLGNPDVNLGVGSGTHARQTADVMTSLEPVLLEWRPGLVLVYGDVNSTVAAALVCSKLRIPVGHVEAGLRSRDRRMPEEINRVVTDALADLLFTPSPDADENLRAEGIDARRVHFVGNVMIDTLLRLLPQADPGRTLAALGIEGRPYLLLTLHRPSNVDDPAVLRSLVNAIEEVSDRASVIFPVHPRTRAQLVKAGLRVTSRVHLLEPLGYLDFLALERGAAVVVTDSGGVQEETTFLGVPCVTVRDNTERPVTVMTGTNTLVGRDPQKLIAAVLSALDRRRGRQTAVPALWDGAAATRIAAAIAQFIPACAS